MLSLAGSSCRDSQSTDTENEPDANHEQNHTHSQPNETCFICDADLRDKDRLWCTGHARYEDRCWICQPQLEDTGRPYCKEHSLYEDECFLCHPELKNSRTDGDNTQTAKPDQGGDTNRLWCREHGLYENECGICHPELASELEPGQDLKVRFTSPQSPLIAGVQTRGISRSNSEASVVVFCEAKYNGNELTHITPLTPGVVHRVYHDVGDRVSAGDILVDVASSEIAQAKREFLTAVVNLKVKTLAYERERQLVTKEISARREFEQTETEHEMAEIILATARQQLLNYGFTAEEIKKIKSGKSNSSMLRVRAPYPGTLVERTAVRGEAVAPGRPLFTLVDLSTMWLELSIPEKKTTSITPPMEVAGIFEDLPDVVLEGELLWVSSEVDRQTHMVKARAIVSNADSKLRNNMFGKAKIIRSATTTAITVPTNAVQEIDGKPYVFVKLDEDLYGLRRVSLGRKDSQNVAIEEGLRPEEDVVVSGGFIVKSEFLKSRLGAGCVHN